jgi:hypothetical protein
MREGKLKKWHKLARGIKAKRHKTRVECISDCRKRK